MQKELALTPTGTIQSQKELALTPALSPEEREDLRQSISESTIGVFEREHRNKALRLRCLAAPEAAERGNPRRPLAQVHGEAVDWHNSFGVGHLRACFPG